MIPLLLLTTGIVVSALVCYSILLTRRWHIQVTGDRPSGRRKTHREPVPRIGGIGVFLGFLAASLAIVLGPFAHITPQILVLYAAFGLAFAGGLFEDLTGRASPRLRLAVTLAAAAIAFIWADVQLVRLDLAVLDTSLRSTWFAFGLTLLAVAGVANSINIIDGCNGLAAGVSTIAVAALAVAAIQVGDASMAMACVALLGACAGFLLFNFPFGKIFLGDGGAYFTGFVLATLSILLVNRNPEISAWFPLAVLVYPIWETLFSAFRRIVVQRRSAGAPDARHLHSLIYRRLTSHLVPVTDPQGWRRRSAITSFSLWLAQLAVCAAALANFGNRGVLVGIILTFAVGYVIAYNVLLRVRKPLRRLASRPAPVASD